ncbi:MULTISPECIES: tRNA glutamyl-Q(34) synthetase GluQRS [Brevibacterium]|uniref:Glutamyl-tRNA synthetase n=1 Tax=Brevibacterium antiquum CNRZ 918 TaxID=1255637 RepID=A0A2H1HT84_9MICO|nr:MULTISPECIES: tRNA glutamyl-Q(34) synthetase GluQRS [Brevibacterium]SMX66111.1 glutamyl-tRNA synthetase [Brevibacterium antiquum CNRZ 918]HCG56280.1 tRNA glutamyl-Q(34) synthetase GluQRS [Brevibacterium sp.]
MQLGAGRFAPSPSGDLHIGNIRSGLLAYVRARQTGRRFLWRIEDLDRVQPGAAQSQLEVFADLGIAPDEPPLIQSERLGIYTEALNRLEGRGLVYECYCSRKDIQQAPSAPHSPPGSYPGTCRDLLESEREQHRQRLQQQGRSPALRLRTDNVEVTIEDRLLGEITAPVDDLVLKRGDGVFAYNLIVVVDDAASGVDEVVRGDDLATSAPRQAHLADLLGLPQPSWLHVPLAVNTAGSRLAKRDGAVTYQQLRALGWTPDDVYSWIATSLGVIGAKGSWSTIDDMVAGLDFDRIRTDETVFVPPSEALG